MSYVKPSFLILAAVFATACSEPQETDSATDARSIDDALGTEVAATVNGEPIPMSVFRLYSMTSIGKNADTLTDEERQALMDDLVDYTLLAQAAEEEGMFDERRFAAELALQQLQFVATSMARRHVERNAPTAADIQDVYDQNVEDLKTTEYKLRHIVADEVDDAREVIAKLNEGQTFDAVASEFVEDPERGATADLGWVSLQALAEPIGDLVEAMEVGSYSAEPVETESGHHILLLEDKREVDAPSPESIQDQLLRAAENRKLHEFVTSLRSEATVDISP